MKVGRFPLFPRTVAPRGNIGPRGLPVQGFLKRGDTLTPSGFSIKGKESPAGYRPLKRVLKFNRQFLDKGSGSLFDALCFILNSVHGVVVNPIAESSNPTRGAMFSGAKSVGFWSTDFAFFGGGVKGVTGY